MNAENFMGHEAEREWHDRESRIVELRRVENGHRVIGDVDSSKATEINK